MVTELQKQRPGTVVSGTAISDVAGYLYKRYSCSTTNNSSSKIKPILNKYNKKVFTN